MTTSIYQVDLVNFNIGGTSFDFSVETLQQPHLKDLSKKINDLKNSESTKFKQIYFDEDPDCFKKWAVPYIRHGLLPKVEDIPTFRDKRHLIGIAQTVGLTSLAEYGEELLKTKFEIQIALKDDQVSEYRLLHKLQSNRIYLSGSTKISEIFKLLQTDFYINDPSDYDSDDENQIKWTKLSESDAEEKLEEINMVFKNMFLNKEKTIEFYEILPGTVLHIT